MRPESATEPAAGIGAAGAAGVSGPERPIRALLAAFVLVSLLRLPLLGPKFWEGDDLNIAAAVEGWLRGGHFREVPAYQMDFQFGSYWLLRLAGCSLNRLIGLRVIETFMLLTFLLGGLFVVCMAAWFARACRRSPVWTLPASVGLLVVPEILISTTLYANTPALSLGLAAPGLLWLSGRRPGRLRPRDLGAVALIALALTCRLDALLLLGPVPCLLLRRRSPARGGAARTAVAFLLLVTAAWLALALAARIYIPQILLGVQLHARLFPVGPAQALNIVLCGYPPNLMAASALGVLATLILGDREDRRTLALLVLLGAPSLALAPLLTTPKYLLPLDCACALMLLQGLLVMRLRLRRRWGTAALLLSYAVASAHLFMGPGWPAGLRGGRAGGAPDPGPVLVETHDGPRPVGRTLAFALNYRDERRDPLQRLLDEAIDRAVRDRAIVGILCKDWLFYGLHRLDLIQSADSYSRFGRHPVWAPYPVLERYDLGAGAIEVFVFLSGPLPAEIARRAERPDYLIVQTDGSLPEQWLPIVSRGHEVWSRGSWRMLGYGATGMAAAISPSLSGLDELGREEWTARPAPETGRRVRTSATSRRSDR